MLTFVCLFKWVDRNILQHFYHKLMNELISIKYHCGKEKSQHELPFLNLVPYEEHKMNFAYDYSL